jgi:hypothetical protein
MFYCSLNDVPIFFTPGKMSWKQEAPVLQVFKIICICNDALFWLYTNKL